MTHEQEREAFEAWYEQERTRLWLAARCDKDRGPTPNKNWCAGLEGDWWKGWQARASLAQPASPTIQDLAAGAHYPQATGWSNPVPNAAANAGTAAASASVGVAQPASVPAVQSPAEGDEPLFLLHCGQIDSSGEQDDWDTEAYSGKRVEEFCRQHPGQTVKLYPHVQPKGTAGEEAETWRDHVRKAHMKLVCSRDAVARAAAYLVEEALTELDAALAQQPSPAPGAASQEVQNAAWRKWADAGTVASLIGYLATLDQAAPIVTAYHVTMGNGERRCKTRSLTISRERVDHATATIRSSDTSLPYTHVLWAQPPEEIEAPAVAPEGMALVPVTPTKAMVDAGRWSEYGEETSRLHDVEDDDVLAVWGRMLDAAQKEVR